MAEQDAPQIYLITPPVFELSSFSETLARVLDREPVACLRLSMASEDRDRLSRAADLVREIAHARDIACVIDSHIGLVEPLGLDGVHLADGARSVRSCRKTLGPDPIVGSHCGTSRHDGMGAGEAGADYVCFGPVGDAGLGADELAEEELFSWWSEMIELPVVAEGHLDPALIEKLAPVADWFALGAEVWEASDPAAALSELAAAMR